MALSLVLAAFVPNVHAATQYVSATATPAAGNWTIATDWSTGVVPTASDDVVFDQSLNLTLSQFALQTGTGPYTANSLTFGSTAGLGAFAFQSGNSGTTARTLSLTSGGITVTSDVTGTQSVGTAGGTLTLDAVDGSFEITNNSTQQLNMAAKLSDATMGTSVTVNGTSTGAITLSGANLFTGGLTIKAGTVTGAGGGTEFGTGTVTLGDTTGTASATLSTTTTGKTYANAIILATNPTVGALTIQNAGGTTSAVTYTGGLTGANNLVIASNAGTTGAITFSTNLINNAGTVTNTGTSTGTTTISGGVGSNVTGINQNSTTSALTISTTALTVNSTATTLTNTAGTKVLTVSGGTTGTGNLVLNNNSSTAAGITLSGTSVNHTGTITNSGSGTGSVTISSVIGTNVTGVVQNSTTGSDLILSAANLFTGGLTIKAGTVQLGHVAGAGTGTITLGDSSGTAAANLMLTGITTYTNALVLGNGGTLALVNNAANNTAFAGGITGNNDLALNNNNVGGGALSMSGLINNSGAITLNGTSAQAVLITGGIGSNVTGVTLNSATSAATISSGLAVNSSGTTLTNNNSVKLLTLSGAVSGTGSLILKNNGTLTSGITASNSVNHTGSVTNSGSGTGSTLISGVIESSVTSVTQNSANSMLVLNGANTFAGGLNIQQGTVQVGSATGVGAGTITIGSTGTSGTLDLNGQTETVIGLATAGSAPASQTIGNSSIATNATLSYTGATTSTFGGVIKDVLGSGNKTTALTVNNLGANLTLTGTNTYTGNTTVSSGILKIGTGGSLASGSAVTVSGAGGVLGGTGTINGTVLLGTGASMNLADGAVGTLTLGSSLTINGTAGTNNLIFDLGSTAGTSDRIAVTGAASMTTSGAGVITLNQLGGIPSTYGTSTLITAASGTALTVGGTKFTLATTKAFGETFTLGGTTTTLTVTTAAGTAGPAATWWKGGAANWSTATNWNTDAASSVAAGAAPGYQTNVNFYTTTPAAANLSNTIDVDFDINSLNFASTSTSNVTIGGTKMLTIEAGTANGNTAGNGITVNTPNSGAPLVTISAKVGFASSQTWTVNSGAALTVSGVITDFGAGVTLTKAGAGLLTLSAANPFGNGNTINVNAGTLTLGITGAAGSAAFNLGDTGGSAANATLNLFGPANSVVVRSGNSGTATIGSINSSVGVAVTLPQLTANKAVTLSPGNATQSMNITALTGSGDITVKAIGTVNYGILGGGVNLTTANAGFSGQTNVFAGTLTLTSATGVNLTSWLGTSTSDIMMGDTSGIQSARFTLTPSAAGSSFTRGFTIQAGNGGLAILGVTSVNGGTLSGDLTLNKSVYLVGPNSTANSGGPTTFSGVVSKGAGATGAVSVITSGDRSGYIQLTNSGNTYDGGTVIGAGRLIATTGSLGSGNVVVETGALRLDSTTSLAATKTVNVGSLGALSVGDATMDQTYLQSVVAGTSSGAIQIGLGATAYTHNLDLATLGNGLMYLGADQIAGTTGSTYSGSTLGASGGIYRLGFGGLGRALTITNGVLGGTTQLIVGGTAGFINSGSAQGPHTEGAVILNAANAYSGGTIVNSGSQLRGQAQASGSPFGTGAVTLHNSTLRLLNSAATTTTTTLGNVAYDGASTIQADGFTGGSNTLNLGTLTRNDKGTVTISTAGTNAVLGGTAKIFTSTTLGTTAINTTGGASTMVDAYFTDSNGNYLTYGGTGFAPVANAFTTLGAATGSNSIVKTAAADTTASTKTIAALMIGGVGGNITNATGSNVTLTIASGGINMSGSAATAIGSGTANQAINLDFGAKEAIFTSTGGNTLTITNVISGSGGLTKSGINTLILTSALNTFSGDITINQGSIQANSDGALGNVNNDIFLNGGALLLGNTNSGANVTLNANRTITLGEAGGTIYSGQNGGLNGFSPTIAGKVTGTGAYLALSTSQGVTMFAAGSPAIPNVVITLTDATNDFIAPIYLGSNLSALVALAFSDDHQLGDSTNSVSLLGGNAILQYTGVTGTSTARAINFLDQGGSIEVVNAVTLTASGPISGSGLFNKNGTGTLALTGTSTFSGNTNVNAGVLNISTASGLGQTSAAITGTSGVSGGGVYVQDGAALEVQGGIAIAGTGGKTTYLNGSGVSNGGALRSVSGTNSNAGSMILQTASTIGVDAGKYTASGKVSGMALTKVGAGALEFTAANTYVGGTTVTGGTLIVNNLTGSATGTGAVALAANTTLSGSGFITGLVTSGAVSTVISPGNSPGTLTLSGGLDASAGATFNFELGTLSDQIDLVSGMFLGSSATDSLVFNFSNSGGLVGGSPYTLFTFGSSTGLNYTDLLANVIPAGYVMDTGFGTNGFLINGTNLQAQFAAIPEPSTTLLLGLGLGALTIFRRRRG